MARNTIQKKFVSTIVKGFAIEDGQPVAKTFELDKRCGINIAQTIIRKEVPSFAAVSVEERETLYKMDFDTFKKYATVCEAEDETEETEAE